LVPSFEVIIIWNTKIFHIPVSLRVKIHEEFWGTKKN
jgi:hypothetical protein